MTLRGSLASPMVVPEPIPRLSFHFLKLSSFWSVVSCIVSNPGFEKKIANKIATDASKRGRSPDAHPAKEASQSRRSRDLGLSTRIPVFWLRGLFSSKRFIPIVQSAVTRGYVSGRCVSRRFVTLNGVVCHCPYLLDLLRNCRSVGHVVAIYGHPEFSLAVFDTIHWRISEPPTDLYR